MTFEISTDTADSEGGYSPTTWATDTVIWGNIKTVSGEHQFLSGREGFNTMYKITVRRRSVDTFDDISSYRLDVEGEKLDIQHIDWDELKDDGYSIIYATKIV